MKRLLLLFLLMGIVGVVGTTYAKDKGETSVPTSKKTYTYE